MLVALSDTIGNLELFAQERKIDWLSRIDYEPDYVEMSHGFRQRLHHFTEFANGTSDRQWKIPYHHGSFDDFSTIDFNRVLFDEYQDDDGDFLSSEYIKKYRFDLVVKYRTVYNRLIEIIQNTRCSNWILSAWCRPVREMNETYSFFWNSYAGRKIKDIIRASLDRIYELDAKKHIGSSIRQKLEGSTSIEYDYKNTIQLVLFRKRSKLRKANKPLDLTPSRR